MSAADPVRSGAEERTWITESGYSRSGDRCIAVIDGLRCEGWVHSPSGHCLDCDPPCEGCGKKWPWCECGQEEQ